MRAAKEERNSLAPSAGRLTPHACCLKGFMPFSIRASSGLTMAARTGRNQAKTRAWWPAIISAACFADPTNPDTIYVAQTSLYRSTDGGRTFDPYVGAPSGDDFHVLWIDPRDGNRMLLGVDQGAIATVDGGKTWSSWYNQPTGEFYHVATDRSFPYRVYGAQQDSGTVGTLSRSDYGEITAQDWSPVGGFEYTHIAPDPAHPNLVYSQGWYGSVVRFDRNTGMVCHHLRQGGRVPHGPNGALALLAAGLE